MIMFAVALHFTWSALIMFDDSALNATALHALFHWIKPAWLLSYILLSAASMALFSLMTRSPWAVLFLLPQQVLLIMSASGAVDAIWLAQFADGEIRPRAFIAADQIYSIIAATGHTFAIIQHTLRINR